MSSFIKIAIVDDNRDIRNNLTELVDESANLKMVGVFENGRTAVEEIPRLKPDVVIMDIELPGMDGVECVRQLKPILPEVNFLMLTVYEDSDRLFESLKAGAGGYLLKRTSSTRLLQAIGELQAGGSPMTPEIARRVTQFFSARQPAARSSNVELEQLTPGQKNFLNELAQGYSYKEIADHLGITVHGVRNYIRKIYEKLHVHSRTEALNKYLNR
jgi:DNA-binding NarL/FixJ family response regulator